MHSAKQGLITDEIRSAAADEKIDPETLRAAIADGSAVLVRNKARAINRWRSAA